MIDTVHIVNADNGFIVSYWKGKKYRQRVFLKWEKLCNWLKKQVP